MPRLLLVATAADLLRDFLLPNARHLRERGWEVDGAARAVAADPECVRAFDRVWNVEWSRNPFGPLNVSQTPARIRELVRHRRYDVVHAHMPLASLVTRFALRRRDQAPAVVCTVYGLQRHENGRWLKSVACRRLEKLAARWTDYLVVMNHEDETAALRLRLVPPQRLRYIPGVGLDRSVYSSEAVPLAEVVRIRTELGLGEGDPLLLMVAEFSPAKRHRDAVAAFARLPFRRVHLALAGSGRLLEETRRQVVQWGLAERVHLLGDRSDLAALMRASAATVLPSEGEDLPHRVMESLSLAVPVIGADVRGIRDLLGEGAGVLVRSGDVPALAAAMAWVLDHPTEAREMGQRGRLQMEAYTLHRVLRRYEDLYTEALGAAQAQPARERSRGAAG